MYGLKRKFKSSNKEPIYFVYPFKVVDSEKTEHFDLLLLTEREKMHFTYISNFSRLVRSQKTSHTEKIFICKRCFTHFDNITKKKILHGQEALDQHKLVCGLHKPILPKMPTEGAILEFDAWQKTQRHPVVMYADFEAILANDTDRMGKNTEAFQSYMPMSYGLVVVASDNVPKELLAKYNIFTKPVIYRGSESHQEVAKHFINTISNLSQKIYDMFKINIPIKMKKQQQQQLNIKTKCNQCQTNFTTDNHKVADHCHLSGEFRQTLCNNCNLKIQKPNFVPCYLHNLSNYDAHFNAMVLEYDAKTISIIPNSEEKFISFSKYINSNFTLRFIDTFRFMPSSLSNLARNLVTPDFKKFRETAKVFSTTDMELVTCKSNIYIYIYRYNKNI